MTGERAGDAGVEDAEHVGSGSRDAPAAADTPAACDETKPLHTEPPAAPAHTKPLNAVALSKEVVLDRLQAMLEWLLRRLKRYRAGRGNWWER